MTEKGLKHLLNEIIDEGHGDKELWFGYDGNYAHTAYNQRIYEIDGNDVVIKECDD